MRIYAIFNNKIPISNFYTSFDNKIKNQARASYEEITKLSRASYIIIIVKIHLINRLMVKTVPQNSDTT